MVSRLLTNEGLCPEEELTDDEGVTRDRQRLNDFINETLIELEFGL